MKFQIFSKFNQTSLGENDILVIMYLIKLANIPIVIAMKYYLEGILSFSINDLI